MWLNGPWLLAILILAGFLAGLLIERHSSRKEQPMNKDKVQQAQRELEQAEASVARARKKLEEAQKSGVVESVRYASRHVSSGCGFRVHLQMDGVGDVQIPGTYHNEQSRHSLITALCMIGEEEGMTGFDREVAGRMQIHTDRHVLVRTKSCDGSVCLAESDLRRGLALLGLHKRRNGTGFTA